MQTAINLSNRLRKAASYLPKGSLFADIGSDHAYLPCFVCLTDPTAKAIAGEINEGPYNNAFQTVEKYKLQHQIDVRLGNGLEILKKGEVHQLIITGMGGALIRSILASGADKLAEVNRIIVQPNNESGTLRKWLEKYRYTIFDENILEENGQIYEIIAAEQQKQKQQHPLLTEKELLFGPILMKKQSDVFIKHWKHQYKKYKQVIEEMKKAKVPNNEKLLQFEEEMNWIEEVIQLEA
jgi:tRNA (adenine22-N1)-methyltransferase